MTALRQPASGCPMNNQRFLLWKCFHKRKNWTFSGSDNGGRTAAILTSITSSCKRLGIDPFEYLRDIFQRISNQPRLHLDELLPDRWKAARQAATL